MKIHDSADLYRLAREAPAQTPQDAPKPEPVDGLAPGRPVRNPLRWVGRQALDAVRATTDFLDEHPAAATAVNNSLATARGLKAFPSFIYPTILEASAAERSLIYDTLDALPLKDVNSVKSITVVPEIPSDRPGWVTRGLATDVNVTNYIDLSRKELQNPQDFKKVLIHEVGHTKDYESAWFNTWGEDSTKKPFGEGPYISDYAQTNRHEDYAETYANYHVDPERTRQEVPEKYEAIEKTEELSFTERLIDREEFRETGRWLGEHLGDSRATRNSVQVFASLSGGVQAVYGLDQLRKATQTGDPEQHYKGILNLTAGAMFGSGLLGLPGMAVHSAQRALNRSVSRGEITALDADAGVRTLSDPLERVVRLAGSKIGMTAPFISLPEQFPDAKPRRGLALGIAAGGALGGLTGSIAGPYAGVLAGYHLAGPVGGAVGLVVGALGGYALGTELGGRAGGALARALGADKQAPQVAATPEPGADHLVASTAPDAAPL